MMNKLAIEGMSSKHNIVHDKATACEKLGWFFSKS